MCRIKEVQAMAEGKQLLWETCSNPKCWIREKEGFVPSEESDMATTFEEYRSWERYYYAQAKDYFNRLETDQEVK
jgi:hypothetical protein